MFYDGNFDALVDINGMFVWYWACLLLILGYIDNVCTEITEVKLSAFNIKKGQNKSEQI